MPLVTKEGFRSVPSGEAVALADPANKTLLVLDASSETDELQQHLQGVNLIHAKM